MGTETIRKCELCGSTHRVNNYKGKILLCHRHYERQREHDKINIKKCEICGGTKGTVFHNHEMYLCKKHRSQILRNGKILKRTRFDPNEIVVCEDYAEIILYDQKNNEKARALIDLEDVDKIKRYKWYVGDGGYVSTRKANTILLHRLITDAPEDKCIDHKDLDTLNNRKQNLREATNAQNQCNRGLPINNTSGVKGVYFDAHGKTWRPFIGIAGNSIKLGSFKNFEDACAVRAMAAEKYHGEFAREA